MRRNVRYVAQKSLRKKFHLVRGHGNGRRGLIGCTDAKLLAKHQVARQGLVFQRPK